MKSAVYEGITLDGKAVKVEVTGGVISNVSSIPLKADLPYLLPLLVDAQHNGSLGFAFCSLNKDNAQTALEKIADHLLRHGVGRVRITFPTTSYENLENAASSIAEVLDNDERLNRLYAGIFMEGVFISPHKGWRGAHEPSFIRSPDYDFLSCLNTLSGNRIKMVNAAPEEPGGLDFIRRAAADGMQVSLGHCNPDTATIREAVKLGARFITHFGNGASLEIHRFKNPFWGYLAEDELIPGLIGDGFHLPPEVVKTVLAVKGIEKCYMVSDASAYAGCPPGEYCRAGGVGCVIKENGFISVIGQDVLAGAYFQNDRSVEYLVNNSLADFKTAWRLCSTNPAALCGIDLPEIATGADAGFVLARFEDCKLSVEKTVFCGREYSGL